MDSSTRIQQRKEMKGICMNLSKGSPKMRAMQVAYTTHHHGTEDGWFQKGCFQQKVSKR